MVDDVVLERLGDAVEGDGLVDGAVGEAGGGREVGGVSAKEAELGVGIEAAMTNPAAEEEIAATEKIRVCGGSGGEESADLGSGVRG